MRECRARMQENKAVCLSYMEEDKETTKMERGRKNKLV